MDSIYTILIIEFAVILLIPLLCRKIHIPAIVGFILVGVLLGPCCLKILSPSDSFDIIGKLGVLYIMFQVGIDLDKNTFHYYRGYAVFYGLLSFLFPFGLGLLAGLFVLHYSLLASLLLGAVLGSHTLMTYPIVSQYGIQRHSAVNVIVGGTIVAVTLSLSILAYVKDIFLFGDIRWKHTILLLLVFILITLYAIPSLLHFILKRSRNLEFEFMLIMLCLVFYAWLSDYVGLDGILGAYICGLVLNGLVPQRSSLMERINLVGDSFLVPLFLVNVGLLINLSSFVSDPLVLGIALLLISAKLIGKGLAAAVITRIRHFAFLDGMLIWGMTQAASAGTIAIITIGLKIGIFSDSVLNAGVVMICVLCTSASFITEHVSKKIRKRNKDNSKQLTRNIWLLLSLRNGNIQEMRELSQLSHMNNIEMLTCNSWQEMYKVIEDTDKLSLLYKCEQPLNTIKRIIVALPKNVEREKDFAPCLDMIRTLSGQIGAPVIFYSNTATQPYVSLLCNKNGKYLRYEFREMDDWEDMLFIVKKIQHDELVILLSSLPNSPSYNPLFENIPALTETFFSHLNYFIIYPNQKANLPKYKNNDIFIPALIKKQNTAIIPFTKLKNKILKKLQYG